MNLFTFLKSKSGKFVMGLPQKVALTAVLGGAAAGVVYLGSGDGQPADKTPTRAYVMGQSGRNADDAASFGRENTINIAGAQGITSANSSDGSGSGSDWAAADASLSAVDKIGAGRVGGAHAGGVNPQARAAAGRNEGLGGNNGAVAWGGRAQANGAAMNAKANAGASRAAGAMQHGVMATASGGATGNTFGGSSPAGRNGVNGANSNRSGNSLGSVEGYKISGAMPQGSVAYAGAKMGNGSANFGDTRGGRAGRGMQSGDGRTLNQIAKRSVEISQNKYRAANEGSRAFLASSQNSGGIAVENGVALSEGTASEDFSAAAVKARGKAEQSLNDLTLRELQRKQHRQRLMKSMISLIFLTIPAMFAITALMRTARKPGPHSIWALAAAIALGAIMIAAIGVFMADAIKYMKKWGGSGITTASMFVGPALAGLIAISYLKSVGTFVNGLASKINGIFGGGVVGSVSAVGTAMGGGQQLIQETKALGQNSGSSTDKADQKLDGNK
ncbi:hypothetical protein [Candidatus Avelusimicrobium faecicola]|uniref:hypothetical protein n=1 Tax=Candidatus Avelusimicrobium faecicola TaxID=3416205 RepID=UPI003D14D0BC